MTLTTPLSVESNETIQQTTITINNTSSPPSSSNNNNKILIIENERWLNIIKIFSYYDLLALPRYVILTLFLLSTLGGPKYIFFIWPLWTLINFFIYGLYFIHNQVVFYSISIKYPFFDKLQNYLLSINVTLIIMGIWSFLDIIFSALNFFVAIILLLFVALDSDGTISQGWESLYASMVAECLFCILSIIFRIIIIVAVFIYLYQKPKNELSTNIPIHNEETLDHNINTINTVNTTNDVNINIHHDDNKSQVTTSEIDQDHHYLQSQLQSQLQTTEQNQHNQQNNNNSNFILNLINTTLKNLPLIFLLLCICFCILSLIFVSMTLQDFMKSKYYLTDKTTDTNNKGCDPMIKKTCLLPYPSSFYLQPSSSTQSNYQVSIPSSALPFTKRGVQIRAKYSANHFDGFGVGSMIVWALDHDQSLDNSQLVSYENIPQSLNLESPTLLINSKNGELHSHFSERDYIDENNNAMGYMMPTPSLLFNTTYIAVVKGLKNKQNNFLKASDLTQQYLDAYNLSPITIPSNLIGDLRYIRFQTIYFPLMEQIGINLTNTLDPIQIIWDFHTGTHQSLTDDLESAKIKTNQIIQEKISNNEKLYDLVKDTHDNSCNGQGKMSKIDYYKVKTPWYMKNHMREKNSIRRKLLELSNPDFELTEYAGLLLQIPCSVTKGEIPATALVEVGHGIFWDRTFALGQWIRQQAGQEGWILWSMDWRGATKNDIPQFGRLLSYDFSKGVFFLQSSMIQGYSDKLAGSLIVRNILEREYGNYFTKSNSIYTPSTLPGRYIGMSLGSILGAGWIAYSEIHHRAVLLAGGSSFSFLLARSDLFEVLMLLCDFQFYTRTDLRVALQLMQASVDGLESTGWAHTGRYNKLQILVQNGLGDATVTPISGRILAKNINASIITPTIPPEGNLPEIPAPIKNGSHLYFQVEYVHEYDSISSKSKPSDPNSVHSCFPERNEIISTSQLFLANGSFVNPCGSSPCVYDKWVHCD